MFMIIFIAVCTISSTTIVKIRKKPVLKDYKLEPVVANPSHRVTLDPSPTTTTETPFSRNQFPVSALSPKPLSVTGMPLGNQEDGRSTIATSIFGDNVDDSSEMDWTPTQTTQTSFAPREPVPLLATGSEASSVPPSSLTPRLYQALEQSLQSSRRPDTQVIGSQVYDTRTKDSGKSKGLGAFGLSLDDIDETNEMDIAPPRLNLKQQETGLENLFNNVFSLSDEPAEIASGLDHQSERPSSWIGAAFWTLVIAVCCGITAAWFIS